MRLVFLVVMRLGALSSKPNKMMRVGVTKFDKKKLMCLPVRWDPWTRPPRASVDPSLFFCLGGFWTRPYLI